MRLLRAQKSQRKETCQVEPLNSKESRKLFQDVECHFFSTKPKYKLTYCMY